MQIVSNVALISINETLVVQLISFLIFLFVINRIMFSSIATPGGHPSTVAPNAGPWLSPQVVTRKRWPKLFIDIWSAPLGIVISGQVLWPQADLQLGRRGPNPTLFTQRQPTRRGSLLFLVLHGPLRDPFE